MAVLLAIETLLGAILIAFPQSRACITAALDWVRAVRILKRTPPQDLVDLAEAPPATVAPVMGNFKILFKAFEILTNNQVFEWLRLV